MVWIRKNKRLLNLSIIILVCISLVTLYIFRNIEETTIESWQLGLIMLPWLMTTIFLLPLIYLSWFGSDKKNIFTIFKKLFYWTYGIGFIIIWIMLYGTFVFQIF